MMNSIYVQDYYTFECDIWLVLICIFLLMVGAFMLYDIDGDGYISREEMMRVVSAMYRMIGNMVPLPVGEETPEKRVNKIFELVDTDQDGRISFREFKEGCRNDPSIAQGIALYDGMV